MYRQSALVDHPSLLLSWRSLSDLPSDRRVVEIRTADGEVVDARYQAELGIFVEASSPFTGRLFEIRDIASWRDVKTNDVTRSRCSFRD